MAANARVHAAPGWADGEILTHLQAIALDAGQAAAVRRDSTHSGTREIPIAPSSCFDAAGGALAIPDNTTGNLIVANGLGRLWIPIQGLPVRHVLTRVRLTLKPAAGHVAPPASLPRIDVYRKSGDLAGSTLLGSGTHAWVDIATYEVGIALETAAFSETIGTGTYWLRFTPEAGANSVTGTELYTLTASVTMDTSEGGPDLTIWT